MKFLVSIFIIGLITTVWSQNECPNDFQVDVKTARTECIEEVETQDGKTPFSRKVRQIYGERESGSVGDQNKTGGHRGRGRHNDEIFECIMRKLQNDQFVLDIKNECQQQEELKESESCVAEKVKKLCYRSMFRNWRQNGNGRSGGGRQKEEGHFGRGQQEWGSRGGGGGLFEGGRQEEGHFGWGRQESGQQGWGSREGGHQGEGHFGRGRQESGQQGWGSREGGRNEGNFDDRRGGDRRHHRLSHSESDKNDDDFKEAQYGNPFEDDDDEEEE